MAAKFAKGPKLQPLSQTHGAVVEASQHLLDVLKATVLVSLADTRSTVDQH